MGVQRALVPSQGKTFFQTPAPKTPSPLINRVLEGRTLAAPEPGITVQGTQPVSTTFNTGTPINRNDIRSVTADQVSTNRTQSVDQLGGADSAFFRNMMSQYAPAFQQARLENAAAAREGAGTLTGSGFANRLGSALNRSLGNEQMIMANLAKEGMTLEMSRQQQDEARLLQAAGMNQSANLQAGTANQRADTDFMSHLLTQNAQGLQAQQLGSQAQQFNSSQDAERARLQAQLDAQRQNLTYSTSNQNQIDRERMALEERLQQQRIAAEQAAKKSGTSGKSVFGSILGGIAGSIGGPIGTAIGGKVGGFIGGLFK